MDIYVLNRDFKIIGVIDSYSSVIWTRRYYTYGDFELVVTPDSDNLNLLAVENMLVRDKDVTDTGYKNVMIIRNIQITTDAEAGNSLIVSGYCLKSILTRRIIPGQIILTGTVQKCIESLIEGNMTKGIPRRNIPRFRLLGNYDLGSPVVRIQVTGKNLEDKISELCMTYGYGYDVDIRNNYYYFYMYAGKDRTYKQDILPYVIMSPEYGNLINSDYLVDNTGYISTAYVAGEGEGAERRITAVGDDARGLDRFEGWVDARNASSNNGEISEDDYLAMLKEEGEEVLEETRTVTSFSGEIDPNVNYVLGRDYDLGDIIQIENQYGISAAARITEIIESEDESGISIIPTFSEMEVN